MPFLLALLPAILPSLVHVAEGVFKGPDRGPEKKDFVMRVLGYGWDELCFAGVMPEAYRDKKEIAIAIAAPIIDQTVLGMKNLWKKNPSSSQ